MASAAAAVWLATSMLAMYFMLAPVPNRPVYTQRPEIASSTGRTASTLWLAPDTNVVASRGATMPGLPLIGQSSRSPPAARTASRQRCLQSTAIVDISMCTVPGRSPASVPAGPQITCSTALASGTMDSSTSDRAATSAALRASAPPAAASAPSARRR